MGPGHCGRIELLNEDRWHVTMSPDGSARVLSFDPYHQVASRLNRAHAGPPPTELELQATTGREHNAMSWLAMPARAGSLAAKSPSVDGGRESVALSVWSANLTGLSSMALAMGQSRLLGARLADEGFWHASVY